MTCQLTMKPTRIQDEGGGMLTTVASCLAPAAFLIRPILAA